MMVGLVITGWIRAAQAFVGLVLLVTVAGLSHCCQQTPPPPTAPSLVAAPDAATDVVSPTEVGEDKPDAERPCVTLEDRATPRRMPPRPRTTRIVGGSLAAPDAFPFALALGYRSGTEVQQFCGATLLRSRWALTAAHCAVRVGDVAMVGSHYLAESRVVAVELVRTHHLYQPASNDYDVALVELSEFLTLPTAELVADSPDAGEALAIGWGATSEGGATTALLRQVSVPLVDRTSCAERYPGLITDRMLCAGKVGQDACQGDSGGPLLVGGMVAGITSWGVGCARPGAPGVYTDVAQVRPWIEACAE